MKQVTFPDSWKILVLSNLCAKHSKEKGCTYCNMLFLILMVQNKKGGDKKPLKAITAKIFITNNIC